VSGPALRPATPDDVEAIAGIWHRGWGDGHLGHVPEALLEHRHYADFLERVPPRIPDSVVAEIAGRIMGFVTVRGDEVEQVYVAAEGRGTGVADALLSHAEGMVAARFDVAWLSVVEGNTRARRFYERSGWRDTGPHDYRAEIRGGTIPVPCRRYEKRVRSL
jgi:ribosomal protein S18 acetylase RimI-like enzyme